jgi:hypothetical protein
MERRDFSFPGVKRAECPAAPNSFHLCVRRTGPPARPWACGTNPQSAHAGLAGVAGNDLRESRNRIEPHISRVALLCGCSLHGLSG